MIERKTNFKYLIKCLFLSNEEKDRKWTIFRLSLRNNKKKKIKTYQIIIF